MDNSNLSFKQLGDQIIQYRREIKSIMIKESIYDWPQESEFPSWVEQEVRFSKKGKAKILELGEKVEEINRIVTKRLGRES